VGYEKIAIFDQCLILFRGVNALTVKCCKHSAAGPCELMTLI